MRKVWEHGFVEERIYLHYKDDLIQLVPKNYHQLAHQGTVKDLKLLAAMGGAGASIYTLLADFMERGK